MRKPQNMPIIDTIPRRYQKGLEMILNLPDNIISEFQTNLDNITDAYTLKDLINQVAEKSKKIPENDIIEIITAIKSLIPLIEEDGVSPEEVSEDIFKMIEKGLAENIKYKKQNKDTFKNRLIKLIQTKSINYTSKAYEIITATQNTFMSARILTDIRPIFGEKVSNPPKVVSIIHNLKIHYEESQSTEHKDIYFALDSNDIQILKDLLKRAEEKEKSINEMFKDTNIKLIELEREQ